MLNGTMASAAVSLDRVASGVSETTSDFMSYETVSPETAKSTQKGWPIRLPPPSSCTSHSLSVQAPCPWCLQSRWNPGHCPCPIFLRASPGVMHMLLFPVAI